ncbi:MFS transporter [Gryllotalpicola reticulitermitis]|uniref:MFS transporter n=1 Tax=Gryllotalpicola reticulitermitis TaxID=1184153 RepID=A0ABV8Q4C6_9MICO
MSEAQTARWSDLFAPSHRSVVVALAAGAFLFAVNVYLTTTIAPSLVSDIGGVALYAWTTTVFVFTALIGSTCAAVMLSAAGPRWAYRSGMIAIIVGTILCAVAPTMSVFLIGRLVQGFGSGLVYALAFALIRETLPPTLWPRASGMLSAMYGIATIVGPAIGGLAAQFGLWRIAFWVLVPVALYFLTIGARRLPRRAAVSSTSRVPVISIVLLAVGVFVIAGASVSATAGINVAGIIAAIVIFAGWLVYERLSGGRILPVETFSRRSPLGAYYVTMVLLVIASTVEVFVPYFAQHLQMLGALAAGYFGAAMAAGWSAGSMLLNGAQARRGLVMQLGPVISAVGLILLVIFAAQHSESAVIIVAVILGLVLLGWGVGMVWPHLVNGVLTSASERSEEIAGSSISTIQLVATAAGSAIAGLITNLGGLTTPGGISGAHNAARLLFAIFLIAPLVALPVIAVATRQHRRTAIAAEAIEGGEAA